MSNDKQEKDAAKSIPSAGDQPTRLMPTRHAAEPTESADAPTRILESSSSSATVVLKPASSEDDVAAATRLLEPANKQPSPGAESAHPETHVSMPHAPLPAAPLATAVSVPINRVVQVPAPRTGASASPSAARTAGSAADEEDELPKVGELIKQRFELIEELGRGGMGAVFRARDLRKTEAFDPDPYVAIKFITGALIGFEKAFVSLQREAKNAQSLNHPNIVKVFDFDRDENLVYLTMEVVEGVALHSRLRASQAKPLSPAERDHLTRGMLAGMSYAHSRDLSHADLKPSNMMVDSNGDLKILDFGIARRREYDTVFDADDLFALTIDYASLEMLNRQRPIPSDDVYALGCIIYAMHAGAHPFNHVRADLAYSEKMRPTRPKSLRRVEWQALRKALAFKREQRFVDAAAFQRAFEAPDWRKIGGIAAAVLSALLVVGWLAADPIQSWMTRSRLDQAQLTSLTSYLKDGSEYLAGGYSEDAVFAYADALKLDSHSSAARSGVNSAFAAMKAKLSAAQYRDYLQSQQQEENNPAWLKSLAADELKRLP